MKCLVYSTWLISLGILSQHQGSALIREEPRRRIDRFDGHPPEEERLLRRADNAVSGTRVTKPDNVVGPFPHDGPFPVKEMSTLPLPTLTPAEIKTQHEIAGELFRLTRPTFNERLGLALPGFYLKRTVQYLEFLFLLDSSSSVGSSNFEKAKDASKVLVDYINNRSPISSAGSKFGLTSFSSPNKIHVEFSFGKYSNVQGNKNAIGRASYNPGSSTATADALLMAKAQFKLNGPSISNITNVIWLVTDGTPDTGGNAIHPARQLKEDLHVKLCVVVVGSSISLTEFNAIASPGCVFQVTSFSSYKRIIEREHLETSGHTHYAQEISSSFFS